MYLIYRDKMQDWAVSSVSFDLRYTPTLHTRKGAGVPITLDSNMTDIAQDNCTIILITSRIPSENNLSRSASISRKTASLPDRT